MKKKRLCKTLELLRVDAAHQYLEAGFKFFQIPEMARKFYEIDEEFWLFMGGEL